jgi:hypothetical protein
MKPVSRPRLAFALLLLAIAGIGFFMLFNRFPDDPVIILPGTALATSKLAWQQRFMRTLPAWVWRLKSWLLPARGVDLDATFLEFAILPEATLSNLALGTPRFTGPNKVMAWVVSAQALPSLRDRLKQLPQEAILSHPRVATSDGVKAILNVGISARGVPPTIGVVWQCEPNCRRHAVDLRTAFFLEQAVLNENGTAASYSTVTNLILAARLQIPDRGGIFLVSPGLRESHESRIGTLISASMR